MSISDETYGTPRWPECERRRIDRQGLVGYCFCSKDRLVGSTCIAAAGLRYVCDVIDPKAGHARYRCQEGVLWSKDTVW